MTNQPQTTAPTESDGNSKSEVQLTSQPLVADEILIAEFEYISASAFQANEDRSKAASFFLVSVGSLIAAAFGTNGISESVYEVLGILFAILTIFGFLTVAQLARLRLAWRGSAEAMNRIKAFYIKKYPELDSAFLFDKDKLPEPFKWNSISYITVIEVSLISGLTAGTCVYFWGRGSFCMDELRELIAWFAFGVLLANHAVYFFFLFLADKIKLPKKKLDLK